MPGRVAFCWKRDRSRSRGSGRWGGREHGPGERLSIACLGGWRSVGGRLPRASWQSFFVGRSALLLPGFAFGVSSSALRMSERLATRASREDPPRGEAARLGRLLASASGYDVLSSEGRSVGQLEHVRYHFHTDHPDEIVVSRLRLVWKRRRVLPFNAVEAVDARAGTVTLRLGWDSVERAPSA